LKTSPRTSYSYFGKLLKNSLEALVMLGKFIKLRSILTVMIFMIVAAVLLNQTATTPASASGGTVSVIVEFRDDPAAVYKARSAKSGQTISNEGLQVYRSQLAAKQDEFLSALAASGVTASVMTRNVKNFDGSLAAVVPLRYTLVYNGVALNVPAASIGTIEGMPQVKKVHPNGLLYTQLNSSVNYIGAPKVYGAVKELTQFDDLREGYEGQGINISIIDTGIDWTHPMFGGDATPPRLGVAPPTPAVTSTNKKVIYYLPLTDIAANDGFGHGTHVASTAAGYLAQAPGSDNLPNTTDDIKLHGVAPQAKLMSYKVCSDIKSSISSLVTPIGGCEHSDTIMALEDSVSPFTITGQSKPVAHVINMSLGGAGGPDSPTAVAASNAALLGTTVVASSGNSGPGDGTTGAPAAGTHVISVGATTHPGGNNLWSVDVLQANAVSPAAIGAVTPAKNLSTQSGFNRMKLFPMAGTPAPPAGAIAQRYVLINDPLVPWPASVRGRIALVKNVNGIPTFAYVANMAAQSGAVGVIRMSPTENPTAVTGSIPSANILPEDGEILIDAISSTDDNNVDPVNGTISELPIRMNPNFSDKFMGEMGGFSSRGPVRGFGQIKPDVSAPGVLVYAAVPPASLLGALAAAGQPTAPNYIAIDGTSMASPHVAGAAALIKQAHPDWSPDMIRTALTNTATNMRNETGAAKADGSSADSILAQGGGLINVPAAMSAKALMGVEGDGLNTPGILGSHSYGEVPVINSRVSHTSPVTVSVRDLSGQGGTYNLRVANNRELERSGISVTLSSASVSVPANGSASYTVNATVDGNIIRNTSETLQMQWYVVAERAGGGQTLRMPFYLKPAPTIPSDLRMESQPPIVDTMPAMDYGNEAVAGVTYKEYPVEIGPSVLSLEATLEFLEVNDSGYNDLDLYLYGPDNTVVGLSGVPGGPEYIKIAITKPGTYTWRVTGFANVPNTEFTLTTTQGIGTPPPALQAIAGDFTNAQGKAVDFDGSLNLSWQAAEGATGYEVERSTDGTNYQVISNLGAGQTSLALADQANGENFYRVRALTAGRIGSYVTAPGNAQSVVVDRRGKVDITAQVSTAMSNVTFAGGVFKLDLNVKNNSTSTYVPLVELSVVRVTSTSGTVSVKNADNNGDGKSAQTAALFGYSNLLGADQQFAPAETTGNRSLEFNDSAAEMFSFDVVVTAYERGSGGASASGGGESGAGSAGGSSSGSGASLQSLTKVMRITVNPLTRSVVAKLL
jgi:subtilisin family serine protease